MTLVITERIAITRAVIVSRKKSALSLTGLVEMNVMQDILESCARAVYIIVLNMMLLYLTHFCLKTACVFRNWENGNVDYENTLIFSDIIWTMHRFCPRKQINNMDFVGIEYLILVGLSYILSNDNLSPTQQIYANSLTCPLYLSFFS